MYMIYTYVSCRYTYIYVYIYIHMHNYMRVCTYSDYSGIVVDIIYGLNHGLVALYVFKKWIDIKLFLDIQV